jgi:hypothetical protein
MFMTTEQNIGTTNIRDILLIDTDTLLKIKANQCLGAAHFYKAPGKKKSFGS